VSVLSWPEIRVAVRPRLATLLGAAAGAAYGADAVTGGALAIAGLTGFLAFMGLFGDFPRSFHQATDLTKARWAPRAGQALFYGAVAPAAAWFAVADLVVVLIRVAW
jgi:hypothetical protein